MNKDKLLYLKKKLFVYGSMIAMMPSIYGCSLNHSEVKTFFENDNIDNISFDNKSNYVVIKLIDANGNENKYLAFKTTMLDIKSNNYELNYPYIKDYDNDGNIIYIDMFTKDVLLVNYNYHSKSVNYDFYDKNIIEEKRAIDFVSGHIGIKDNYTKEELAELFNKNLKK